MRNNPGKRAEFLDKMYNIIQNYEETWHRRYTKITWMTSSKTNSSYRTNSRHRSSTRLGWLKSAYVICRSVASKHS
jgi:hypothetical protein